MARFKIATLYACIFAARRLRAQNVFFKNARKGARIKID